MKKLIAALVLAVAIVANAQTNTPTIGSVHLTVDQPVSAAADTNSPPTLPGVIGSVFDFLTANSTNWMVASYGIYANKPEIYGAGVGAFYLFNQYAGAGLRLDYLDGQFWMPSANIQLQLPLKLMGKVTVVPFVETGIATPISGAGDMNQNVVGIFGGGMAIPITKKLDLVYAAEAWTGFDSTQHRFGVLWKF